MVDVFLSLIVIIISQCIRTSEHHTVPLKHIFVKNKHSFFFLKDTRSEMRPFKWMPRKFVVFQAPSSAWDSSFRSILKEAYTSWQDPRMLQLQEYLQITNPHCNKFISRKIKWCPEALNQVHSKARTGTQEVSLLLVISLVMALLQCSVLV